MRKVTCEKLRFCYACHDIIKIQLIIKDITYNIINDINKFFNLTIVKGLVAKCEKQNDSAYAAIL